MAARFQTSDKSSAAPKLNWLRIYQLFGPHNCIVVSVANEAAVPAQLAIVINCHKAIMVHCTCSKTKPASGI